MNDFEEILATYESDERQGKRHCHLQFKESGPLSRLLASAVSDGTIDDLQRAFPKIVNLVSISNACGTEGVDYDLIPGKFRYEGGYMKRVIRSDNVELFIKYRSIIGSEMYLMRWASKYCAKRIMIHIGFSPENVGEYIRNAFRFLNKNILLFLLENGSVTRKQIGNIFCHLLVWRTRLDHSFIVDCFRGGPITLTQEQWEEFERLSPELYCLIQDDV